MWKRSVKALKHRNEQQQLELESVSILQSEEQKKLQNMAVARLLLLTEKNYENVLENLDDDAKAVFHRYSQVEDALSIWSEKYNSLKTEKKDLQKKLGRVRMILITQSVYNISE